MTNTSLSLAHILRRPEVTYENILDAFGLERASDAEVICEINNRVKYDGYIQRQMSQISKFKKIEGQIIPDDFKYDEVVGFSSEVLEKLNSVRPRSIGQASRISGITPAAISLLMISLERRRRQNSADEEEKLFHVEQSGSV